MALVCLMAAWPSHALDEGEVRAAQARLIEMGFMDGEPDGVMGEQTQKAIERLGAYALSVGSDATGDQLIDALIAGEISLSATPTKKGDISENVMRAQRRLHGLGYLTDTPDGTFGDNTERALFVFQWAASLNLTGETDEQTQRLLFGADAPIADDRALAKGKKGEAVAALQRRLAQMGFLTALCDGHYGEDTVVAVKAFQSYMQSSGAYDVLPVALRQGKINGLADPFVQRQLFSEALPVPAAMQKGDTGQEVYRLQRRLIALGYLDGKADGGYGEATERAVAAFQKRADLKENGKANDKTIARLFAADAPEPIKPFKLVVDVSDKKLYVYKRGSSGQYDQLTYTMRCAIGPLVEEGSYGETAAPIEDEWLKLRGRWVRYPFTLNGSAVMIHSIPHDAKQGEIDTAYLNVLGGQSDHGSIVLSVEDARLIYEKCPRHTPVEVVA